MGAPRGFLTWVGSGFWEGSWERGCLSCVSKEMVFISCRRWARAVEREKEAGAKAQGQGEQEEIRLTICLPARLEAS